jgi:uncharacterized membrane protein YczE
MVRAGLGLGPWAVFHQGVANHTGLTIGLITNGVGALLLLLWIPLRQRPGIGTVANVLLIGTTADLILAVLPAFDGLPLRIAALIFAVLLNGVAGGLYIGAGLGPGPRDGLMTGAVRLTGWPSPMSHRASELVVLAAGLAAGRHGGRRHRPLRLRRRPLVGVFLPIFDVTRRRRRRRR